MSLRAAVLLVILAAIASTERKQLSGPELERFLGPAGSNLIKWNKRIVPDGEFYEDSADPTTLGNSKHQYLTFRHGAALPLQPVFSTAFWVLAGTRCMVRVSCFLSYGLVFA